MCKSIVFETYYIVGFICYYYHFVRLYIPFFEIKLHHVFKAVETYKVQTKHNIKIMTVKTVNAMRDFIIAIMYLMNIFLSLDNDCNI